MASHFLSVSIIFNKVNLIRDLSDQCSSTADLGKPFPEKYSNRYASRDKVRIFFIFKPTVI
ncbi:hypothetical protein HZS_1708 [Henneguya salminicola]|nr:hypothetical protein HZS_1708 [Henneguya salminicola]